MLFWIGVGCVVEILMGFFICGFNEKKLGYRKEPLKFKVILTAFLLCIWPIVIPVAVSKFLGSWLGHKYWNR